MQNTTFKTKGYWSSTTTRIQLMLFRGNKVTDGSRRDHLSRTGLKKEGSALEIVFGGLENIRYKTPLQNTKSVGLHAQQSRGKMINPMAVCSLINRISSGYSDGEPMGML